MKNQGNKRNSRQRHLARISAALLLPTFAACTGQIPRSFRFQQQEEEFNTISEFNTKIDLLWVVDNSASMDVNQLKLRKGFKTFAEKYMRPTWDIRTAVITTDTYLAHDSFNEWLGKKAGGSTGWQSQHIYNRRVTWSNPSWNGSLVDTSDWTFKNGILNKEMVPAWGALGKPAGTKYSWLEPGLHDGPITALCTEGTPTLYFYAGNPRCAERDDQTKPGNTGTAGCLTSSDNESITQCVNTVMNDSVHSNKAILETMPKEGPAVTTEQLIADFMINATTGSAGQGSERGLGSVLQMIEDNERKRDEKYRLFRPGSVRAIIFVTDEDDQTMILPEPVPTNFRPTTWYKCDKASLERLNPSATEPNPVSQPGGYCCASGCALGAEGTSCTTKNIDGYEYAPSICPREDKLMPIVNVKTELDRFFRELDAGANGGTPNYFVVNIIPMTGATIQKMQDDRKIEDQDVRTANPMTRVWNTHPVDRGDRYIELEQAVKNGSVSLDMGANDYTALLNSIGRALVEKKSSFTLTRVPTGEEDMVVYVIHAGGSRETVPSDKYVIEGKTLTFTDPDFVLGFSATDKISINYQPKSVN